MTIGYARVSTSDQHTDSQIEALREAGAEKIFEEKGSGGRWDRPEFQKMLDHLRKGDVVMVWKLDRLSRSLLDLLRVIAQLDDLGVGFRSLTEHIDTTTPAGRMMLQMIGAFAEFEREMIRQRTREGLKAAKKKGRVGGRPKALTDEQIEEARQMIASCKKTKADIARLFKVHPSTIGRLVSSDGG